VTTVFASNPLQPLIDLFEAVLSFFHDSVGLGWGLAIVVLTLIVRVCLLPLTLKQFKSMQSMARHQPEMKKLQAKYKDDKDRLNQELMKFYRENKINPLASCLPLLAQIPVFISLFYMLRKDLRVDICPDQVVKGDILNSGALEKGLNPHACPDGGSASFFFIDNLTTRATGGVLVTLIILYVGSQLISTVMSTVSADKTQKYLMYGLPFFFVTFVFQFPAGLLLYWITTNLWTIVQQLIVRKRLGPLRPPPDPDAPPEEKGPGLLETLGIGQRQPATAAASPKGRPTGPPPAPPRKKKKRSGRRR
jgi:YidC/Oxa1 family membrane protein insertase